jgi:CrcB protein
MIAVHPVVIMILLVGSGGAIGAICRALSGRLLRGEFPVSTLLVNVSGSFLYTWIQAAQVDIPMSFMVFAGIGFCGAFTTFSTFILETVLLYRAGLLAYAWLNFMSTLILCLLASYAALCLA